MFIFILNDSGFSLIFSLILGAKVQSLTYSVSDSYSSSIILQYININ